MTANMANQTTVTRTSNTSSVSPTLALLVGSLMALLFVSLISLKAGAILMGSFLAGAAYVNIRSFQRLNFDFELENDLMMEIVDELEYRNN